MVRRIAVTLGIATVVLFSNVSRDAGVGTAELGRVAEHHVRAVGIINRRLIKLGSTGLGAGGRGRAEEHGIIGQNAGRTQLFQTVRISLLGKTAVEIARILRKGQTDLLQIAGAGNTAGAFARLVQSRQQHARQNRDDRDHDEEFDQGKPTTFLHFLLSPLDVISDLEPVLETPIIRKTSSRSLHIF